MSDLNHKHGADETASAATRTPESKPVNWRMWRKDRPDHVVIIGAQHYFEACRLAEILLNGESMIVGEKEEA